MKGTWFTEIRPLEKSDDIKGLVMSLLGDADAGKVSDELILSFLHDGHYHAFVTKQGDHSAAFAAMKCDPFEGANEVGEYFTLPGIDNYYMGKTIRR